MEITMKAKTYDALVNLINTACIYLLLLSLFFTLQGRSYPINRQIVLDTLLICSVTFIYYVARKYVKNLVLFLLLHITPTVLYLVFFKAPTERYLYFALLIIVFPLISMAIRYNSKSQKLTAMGFAPIIMIVIFYFFIKEDNTRLQGILSSITFAFVILVIINTYLVNIYNFITSNESAIGEAVSIRKASSKFFRLFVFLTFVFCISFSSLSSNFVFKYFRGFLYKILSIIADFFVTEPKEEIIMPSAVPNDLFEKPTATVTRPPQEPEVPFDFGVPNWLIYTVAILVGIGLVVLLCYVLIRFFKKAPSNLEDVHEFVSPFEKKEKTKVVKKKKKSHDGFTLIGNYDKRIRKIFKKTISKNMNPFIKINKAHTPTQLCDSTERALDKNKEFTALRGLYLKARYSEETITKEDFNQAKDLSDDICLGDNK